VIDIISFSANGLHDLATELMQLHLIGLVP